MPERFWIWGMAVPMRKATPQKTKTETAGKGI
jgi:hypothetical protein